MKTPHCWKIVHEVLKVKTIILHKVFDISIKNIKITAKSKGWATWYFEYFVFCFMHIEF